VREPGRQVDNRVSAAVVHMGAPVLHRPTHIMCKHSDHVRARTLMRLVSSVIWL
jgi:hypothetical protein